MQQQGLQEGLQQQELVGDLISTTMFERIEASYLTRTQPLYDIAIPGKIRNISFWALWSSLRSHAKKTKGTHGTCFMAVLLFHLRAFPQLTGNFVVYPVGLKYIIYRTWHLNGC